MQLPPRSNAKPRMAGGRVRRVWTALFLQERREARAAAHAAPPPPLPVVPVCLNASNAGPYINVAWYDPAGDKTGFRVYRKVDSDPVYVVWRELGADLSSADDSDVLAGHTYYYGLAAFNAAGESTPLLEASVTFQPS